MGKSSSRKLKNKKMSISNHWGRGGGEKKMEVGVIFLCENLPHSFLRLHHTPRNHDFDKLECTLSEAAFTTHAVNCNVISKNQSSNCLDFGPWTILGPHKGFRV